MAWWQRGRSSEPLVARLAGPTDRPALADLLTRAMRQHGVQAVEEQVALLNSGVSSLIFANSRAAAFMGLRLRVPTGAERWAEVAMLAAVSGWDVDKGLETLLAASSAALHAQRVTGLVCLTSESWLRHALQDAGFAHSDQVITYVRNGHTPPPIATSTAVLRPAGAAEAEKVLGINAAAFAPIWRYDEATTLSWLLTSEHAVLAERDGQPAGFALTARASHDGYAQLIRVAVHPDWQGQGVGRSLVTDAIRYGYQSGALGVALNTQASNATSRHLYEMLGFRNVGPAIDVMTYRVE